jgi:hypothetical protein
MKAPPATLGWALALLALPSADATSASDNASATGRALQQAACPCEHCVDAMGQSVDDCQALGLDCACLLDCKCQHCVVVMGQAVADCESLGLDCSCYTGDDQASGGGGYGGGACGDLTARTAVVNDECCDEPSEDCSSGRPATCNLGCARVLLPFFGDCAGALGAAGAGLFDDVVALCRAAEAGPAPPPAPVSRRCLSRLLDCTLPPTTPPTSRLVCCSGSHGG